MQIKQVSSREAPEYFTEPIRVWYVCGIILVTCLNVFVDILDMKNCRAILDYSTASTHVRSRVSSSLEILTNDGRELRLSSKIDKEVWA